MFTKCILTFLVAMVPVVELRGAIPIGMGMGLTLWQAFILSFIGNLVPVPFIILFVRKIFAWLRQKWPKLDSFVSKLENKALSKEDLVKKYEASIEPDFLANNSEGEFNFEFYLVIRKIINATLGMVFRLIFKVVLKFLKNGKQKKEPVPNPKTETKKG